MTNTFGLSREASNKLWVETPFPVSNPVWGYFCFEIFPEFDLSNSHAVWSGHVRSKNDIISVLNRGYREFVISDGQKGYHWNHAYLPDDQRTGLKTSVKGLIYVPEQQSQYLDSISADLSENGARRTEFLSRMLKEHKSILSRAFDTYARKMDGLEGKGKMETVVLMEELRKSMVHYFGYPSQFVLGNGQIPAEYNDMRNYTIAEFLSNVGTSLSHERRDKKTIAPEELCDVSSELYRKYSHVFSITV